MTAFSFIQEAFKLAKFDSVAVEKATLNAINALAEDLIAGDYEPSPDNEKYFTALDAVLVDYREQTPEVIESALATEDEDDEDDYELEDEDDEDDDGMSSDIDSMFDNEDEEEDSL
jgi:hypothetical protein